MRKVKISDVKVFCLAPSDGLNLVIVKVETDRPEIYGLGCATFSYRYKAVASCSYTQTPESRINTELFNHHKKIE